MIPKNPRLSVKIRNGITRVEAGRKEFDTEDAVTPFAVKTYMEKRGYTAGEMDTNGWQYDWWIEFEKNGKSFTAFGSGYYGGFIFSKTEEA